MGNYYCKTPEQQNWKRSKLDSDRVGWKEKNDEFRKYNFQNSVEKLTNLKGVSVPQWGEELDKVAPTKEISISEFLKICQLNRPEVVSDDEWKRFLNSICAEYFKLGLNHLVDSKAVTKSSIFAVPTPSFNSRSSINAVMGLSMAEVSPRLSLSPSVSIVEYAGRFAFPDIVESIKSDAESTSMWLADTKSNCLTEQRSTTVRCLNEFVNAYKVEDGSSKSVKSKFTALCLGDLPTGSYEEMLFLDENKISTTYESSKPQPGSKFDGKDDYTCEVFDEIKPNVEIYRHY